MFHPLLHFTAHYNNTDHIVRLLSSLALLKFFNYLKKTEVISYCVVITVLIKIHRYANILVNVQSKTK